MRGMGSNPHIYLRIQHINQTVILSIPVNTMWYGVLSIDEKY